MKKFTSKLEGWELAIYLPPPYTCLGMGKFEEVVFSQGQSLVDKIKLWKRFIDDILMLFKGTQKECESQKIQVSGCFIIKLCSYNHFA